MLGKITCSVCGGGLEKSPEGSDFRCRNCGIAYSLESLKSRIGDGDAGEPEEPTSDASDSDCAMQNEEQVENQTQKKEPHSAAGKFLSALLVVIVVPAIAFIAAQLLNFLIVSNPVASIQADPGTGQGLSEDAKSWSGVYGTSSDVKEAAVQVLKDMGLSGNDAHDVWTEVSTAPVEAESTEYVEDREEFYRRNARASYSGAVAPKPSTAVYRLGACGPRETQEVGGQLRQLSPEEIEERDRRQKEWEEEHSEKMEKYSTVTTSVREIGFSVLFRDYRLTYTTWSDGLTGSFRHKIEIRGSDD